MLNFTKLQYKSGLTRYNLVFIILIILLLPALFVPFYSRFSYFPEGSQNNSHFADYDYKIASWMSDNTFNNSIILSDYFGMKIYQGLSDRPVFFSGLNAGEESNSAKDALWSIKSILNAQTPESAYYSAKLFVNTIHNCTWISWQERNTLASIGVSLNNPDTYIVITPRTYVWMNQEGIYDVRQPYYAVNSSALASFANNDFFKLVYFVEGEFYIFKLGNALVWNSGYYPAAVGRSIDESLVARWSIDETNGGTLMDTSQYENNGSIYGASYSRGAKGDELVFNGLNDYVSIPYSYSLNFSNSLTIETWLNPSSSGNNDIIGIPNVFMLRVDPVYDLGTISFFVSINGSYEPRARGIVLPTNEWSFVVGTYDGQELKIYVNGILVGKNYRRGDIDDVMASLTIGYVNGHFFNGSLSEIKVYNRTLSAEEIADTYDGNNLNLITRTATTKETSGYLIDVPFNVTVSSSFEIKIESKILYVESPLIAFTCEVYDSIGGVSVFSKNIFSSDFGGANAYETIYIGDVTLDLSREYRLTIFYADNIDVWVNRIWLFG
jgi:hypothetical protein